MGITALTVALVLTGAALLTVSLVHAGSMYRHTREHTRAWVPLSALIALLVVGYVGYAVLVLKRPAAPSDLLAALMFVGGACFVWISNNISQSVFDKLTRIAALQRHRATHDELTALPKGSFFVQHLDEALQERPPTPATQAAVLMLGLNRFKTINDTMGHYYGDILLKEVALRLHRSIRKTDLLARLGGDEFGVLIDPVSEPEHLDRVTENLAAALAQPIAIKQHPADVGVSIGVAWFPDHGKDSITLMKHAKAAMREAKRVQADTMVYSETLGIEDRDQLTVLRELRQAIDRDQLVVHYQPVIDLKTGRANSVEALVRWPHPRLGLLSPDEFIPLAEQNALINRLNYWVLDIVLDQLSTWRQGRNALWVSTNVSPTTLQHKDFYPHVVDGLTRRALSSRQLKLEITESVLMADSQQALRAITALVSFGVGFAIDDFGTGYSSLDYLKKLPVDEVKIDKSFVMNLNKDSNDAIIIRSTIDLAHRMGRRVTAEGVDSAETLELLKKWGCDRAQGFHLSQPLPVAELNERLRGSELDFTS